jgi:hypothetical protein
MTSFGVFDHLLLLCMFTITVLIIIIMSLDIVYHLLYVMHLKLNVIIGEPLPRSHHRDLLRHRYGHLSPDMNLSSLLH